MENFNFFKVLEKDNKELIHSAFIAYLIDSNINFRNYFISDKNEDFEKSELEKSYSRNKKRIRIDIQVKNRQDNFVAFIENKFKSFPTEKQLKDYNKVFEANFDKKQTLKKILFCFDKNIVNFKTDWTIFDYNDLLQFLKKEFESKKEKNDEVIFVKHYISFLEEYINKYEQLKDICHNLFNSSLSNDDKFWIRLLNSQIAIEFEKKFSDKEFDFVINPGNASVPVLNIIPKHWKNRIKQEVLIQFQGKDLKFYLHSENKDIANELISYCEDKLWDENIELKKQSKKKEKSCFIFKKRVDENLKKDFKYKDLFDLIVDFYRKIDEKIINKYPEKI